MSVRDFTWEVRKTPSTAHRTPVAHAFDEHGNSACGVVVAMPADQRGPELLAKHDSRRCSRCEDIVARHKLNHDRPKHTLVVVGTLGVSRAYLDMSPADAVARFGKYQGHVPVGRECPACVHGQAHAPESCPLVKVIEFTDEFNVYAAWED